jgi:uncharacterized protein
MPTAPQLLRKRSTPPLKLSKYAIIAPQIFTAPGHTGPLQAIYSARAAALASVPTSVLAAVVQGDVDSLSNDELEFLISRLILVPADEDETTAVLRRQAAAADTPGSRRFALLPTALCNMDCEYCGQDHASGHLADDAYNATRDRVLAAIEDPAVTTIEVNWFGGEPLLASRAIVALGGAFLRAANSKNKEYRSLVVTNGSLLTVALIGKLHLEAGISKIEITIDGPPEVHDARRHLKNGKTSFYRIIEIVLAALNTEELKEVTYSIRTNVGVSNFSDIEEYISHPALEALKHRRVTLYFAPLHTWGTELPDVIAEKTMFAKKEARWLKALTERGLNTGLLPRHPVGAVCSAVTRNAELIDPSGNIFSCSEQPLVPTRRATRLGNATKVPVSERRPEGAYDSWFTTVTAGDVPCRNCTLLPVCGGACPLAWSEGSVPCPPLKYNILERITIAAQLNGLEVADHQ